MATPINANNSTIANITSALPNNIVKQAAKSAVFSFALTTILSGNPVLGLTSAPIAVTASLIDALVRPLMDKIFDGQNSIIRQVVNVVVVLSAVSGIGVLVAPYVGVAYGVNILATAMIHIGLTLLVGVKQNTDQAECYIAALTMV